MLVCRPLARLARSSYSETHDLSSVLSNESESDSHHTQLWWSRLFQKSVKAWHLHFQWRFQWHFWTLWSSYITAKRWKILTKEMQNKKKLFRQVFDLSLSPIFDQNNSTIPSVAIVAPYRSLFLRLGSTISFDFRDRPLQLWNFLNFFHSFLMSKRKHGKILSPKLMYN